MVWWVWIKVMKSGMKQVQVPPFELILCQDVATASRNPLERLPASKMANKSKKHEKCLWALGPLGPLCAAEQRCGAFYIGPGSRR